MSLSSQSPLRLGDRLSLHSGLLEITYDTGAKVILQGPVTYKVESPAGGYLSLGKLTAKLEKKSAVRGQKSESTNQKSPDLCPLTSDLFTIRTPTATVTDLGTEFGVEVDKVGQTTSHVYRGSVKVQPIGDGGEPAGAGQVLQKDQSARVENRARQQDGSSRVIVLAPSAEPIEFVRELSGGAAKPSARFEVVAHWQFDGENFLADSSGHGHTLVNRGAKQVDGAASFNGAAIMSTIDSIDLTPYKKIRVSWSSKTPAGDSGQILWEHGSNYNCMHGAIAAYKEANEGFAGLRNDSDMADPDTAYRLEVFPVNSDEWETFAVEYDLTSARRSGIIKMFKDGALVGRGTQCFGPAPASFVNAVFHIGAKEGVKNPFVGQIDNLQIEGQTAKNK